ncbi:MAG TPA: M1 family peptidase, partial [Xanthomonadaceae bacterium]|nr:M1 family peptidase [Xanthomonadaceae bacterium]
MRRLLPLAVAIALAGIPSLPVLAADTAAVPAGQTTTQLPRSVRPTHYDVAVVPDAANLRFTGKATIDIDVLAPTGSITLNAIDMGFANAALTSADGKTTFGAPKVTVDADAQTATFAFDQPIAPGSYRLAMDYTGKIGTQANGLFAIDYETKSGKKRALFTQFENSDARRFVPSWDEPAYKATFTLSADVPSGQMAVSNMPAAATTDLGKGMSRV